MSRIISTRVIIARLAQPVEWIDRIVRHYPTSEASCQLRGQHAAECADWLSARHVIHRPTLLIYQGQFRCLQSEEDGLTGCAVVIVTRGPPTSRLRVRTYARTADTNQNYQRREGVVCLSGTASIVGRTSGFRNYCTSSKS